MKRKFVGLFLFLLLLVCNLVIVGSVYASTNTTRPAGYYTVYDDTTLGNTIGYYWDGGSNYYAAGRYENIPDKPNNSYSNYWTGTFINNTTGVNHGLTMINSNGWYEDSSVSVHQGDSLTFSINNGTMTQNMNFSTNLLSGKTLTLSDSYQGVANNTTTYMTDGNDSSNDLIQYQGTGQNVAYYVFPQTMNITAYTFLAASSTPTIKLNYYDSNGALITSTDNKNYVGTQVGYYAMVKDVKGIAIVNEDTVNSSTVDEITLWGLSSSGSLQPIPTVTATAGDKQVDLSWSTMTGATSYNVKRAATAGGPYTTIAQNVTDTSYTDTSVTNGTTYYYVVTAVSGSGESDNSNEVLATPQVSSSNNQTNLSATAGSGQVSLTWDSVSDATSYNVSRSTTSGGPYTAIATDLNSTNYIDTSTENGTTYYYVVTAVTSDGEESGNSNEASATPAASEDNDRLYVLLDLNEQAQLSVTDNLSDNTNLTWTSSDPSIATVDADGKITAVAEGTCKITAANSDGTFTDYIPVKVLKGAEEFRLALNLNAGESKRLWIADDNTGVIWESMDPNVATVDATGKVTAVAKGLCIVQAELNGSTSYIYVRVNA